MLEGVDVGDDLGLDEPPDGVADHQVLLGPLEHGDLPCGGLPDRGGRLGSEANRARPTVGSCDSRGRAEGTPFERWGGEPFFTALVEGFYAGVATDPVLRPMYPEDLAESKEHLALFLGQYWGGPTAYNQLRGHPRLRMRHAPFVIGTTEAEALAAAHDGRRGFARHGPDDRDELLDYLAMAARTLVNSP